MRNRVVRSVRDAHVEELRHLQQYRLSGVGKIPVRKSVLRIAANIGGPVGPQPLRRVVLRIEADAQQVRLGIELGLAANWLLITAKLCVTSGQKLGSGQRV